ncbi:hypothetical protein HDU98_001795, partial [Podochytrium sp. JEL0797]
GQNTGPLWFTHWNPAIVGDTATSRFTNVAGAFVTAFFSFGGTELVGLTAGEAENPRVSVPKAVNGTVYRIVFFYLGSIFFIGVLLDPTSSVLDPNNSEGVLQSPFVYVYQAVGIAIAGDIMNAVIILATLSALNSGIYACSRTLMRLADEGSAPKFLGRVDKRGVPMMSVCISVVAIIMGYLVGTETVFNFLSNLIALSIMINWVIMSYTHLRFRYGIMAQGVPLDQLPYLQPFFPYADMVSIFFGVLVTAFLIFGTFYEVTIDDTWWIDNSWLYCGFPLVVVLFFGRAIWDGVKSGNVWDGFKLVPLMEMDFQTGRFVEVVGEDEQIKVKGVKGFVGRMTKSFGKK